MDNLSSGEEPRVTILLAVHSDSPPSDEIASHLSSRVEILRDLFTNTQTTTLVCRMLPLYVCALCNEWLEGEEIGLVLFWLVALGNTQ